MKLAKGFHISPQGLIGVRRKVDEPHVSNEERIVALGSLRGVKLWNYVFEGSSLLCILVARLDSESFGFPLLFISQATKIFI